MLNADHAAVTAYERHIIATEGPRTVAGTYYPREIDADERRHWLAERMVREARREHALQHTTAADARLRVGTWLTPRERARVDLGLLGHVDLAHRETLHAIRGDLITGRIDAALVSAALVQLPDTPTLSAIVCDFPGNLLVGFIAEADESQALAGALTFGQAGVRALVDARTATGWQALRAALDMQRVPDAFVQRAVRELTVRDPGAATGKPSCSAGWARFIAVAFSPRVRTAKDVAASLGVCASTLTSRFYRVGLPSPKRYVAYARLVWAARLGEAPGVSIAAIAHRLDASSPQSFGRTVRTQVGVTASTFRRQYDGATMLARFRAELIEPYRDALRTFDPLTVSHAARIAAARTRSPRARLTLTGRVA